jgi:hypothetical protein
MSVNLDLGDPVLTVVTFLDADFSHEPVTVITGAERGGYSGDKPKIQPIEGKEGRRRMAEINVHKEPAKAIVLVYEVSYEDPFRGWPHLYTQDSSRVSIDIRMALRRSKLTELYNEVNRMCMQYLKASPGGNWSYLEFAGRQDLTNRKLGIFRIVRDIRLMKVLNYVGHQ